MADGDRNIRKRSKHFMIRPKKDNFGFIGDEDFRMAEGWFVNLFASPVYYSSTMTGSETFIDPFTILKVFFLDPNGVDRNFNPSGIFPAGFIAIVKNIDKAGNYIIFDSTVSAQVIGPGELGIMLYTGTVWV